MLHYLTDVLGIEGVVDRLYGVKWIPGKEKEWNFATCSPSNTEEPGIYLAFHHRNLVSQIDYFGRQPGGPGVIYPVPPNPPKKLQQFLQAQGLEVSDEKLKDIAGFLAYVLNCLKLIEQVDTLGLLPALREGRFPVFIIPAAQQNRTLPLENEHAVCQLTQWLLSAEHANIAGPISDLLYQRYASLPQSQRLDRFLQDLQEFPLRSLFLDKSQFSSGYFNAKLKLSKNFWLDWLAGKKIDIYIQQTENQGIKTREYFLLALLMLLYPVSPPGPGTGAIIEFNARREGHNVPEQPDFRPPAIGLVHQLVHAGYCCAGAAPGYAHNHFTTTAAELLFTGIEPFNQISEGEATTWKYVSENSIRSSWNNVKNPDASNIWAHPEQRTAFELAGKNLKQKREALRLI